MVSLPLRNAYKIGFSIYAATLFESIVDDRRRGIRRLPECGLKIVVGKTRDVQALVDDVSFGDTCLSGPLIRVNVAQL